MLCKISNKDSNLNFCSLKNFLVYLWNFKLPLPNVFKLNFENESVQKNDISIGIEKLTVKCVKFVILSKKEISCKCAEPRNKEQTLL